MTITLASHAAVHGSTIRLRMPIRSVSGGNVREHWRKRAKRVKEERHAAGLVMMGSVGVACATTQVAASTATITRVTFTRIAPRLLDDDNLASGMKGIRDEVALHLGVSDAPSGGVEWLYRQEKGARDEYAVLVDIYVVIKGES